MMLFLLFHSMHSLGLRADIRNLRQRDYVETVSSWSDQELFKVIAEVMLKSETLRMYGSLLTLVLTLVLFQLVNSIVVCVSVLRQEFNLFSLHEEEHDMPTF